MARSMYFSPDEEKLPLACACGKVLALARRIRPRRVNRVICGCRHCRAYARHLGRAEGVLDAFGGTEVFQISPRDLEFREGGENIACLRITRNGPLRWYADCCKTPLAVTFATPAIPFVGVNFAFVDRSHIEGDLDEFLGSAVARVNTRGAATDKGALRLLVMLLRYGAMIVMWRINGDYKRSPFFDNETGTPHREPAVALFSAKDMKAGAGEAET